MKISATIINPTHATESHQFGDQNLWGHVEFSDGKRYRFRYSELKNRPGGWGFGTDYTPGEYHLTTWRPKTDKRREMEVALSPAKQAVAVAAILPLIPAAREIALNAKAEKDAANEAEEVRLIALGRKRLAAEAMFEALERAQELCREALPQFDWGKSALSGEAIRLLNEVPSEITAALKLARYGTPNESGQ